MEIDKHERNLAALSHEDYRKKLWIEVAVAVARAENCRKESLPGAYADACLSDFDRRFKSDA